MSLQTRKRWEPHALMKFRAAIGELYANRSDLTLTEKAAELSRLGFRCPNGSTINNWTVSHHAMKAGLRTTHKRKKRRAPVQGSLELPKRENRRETAVTESVSRDWLLSTVTDPSLSDKKCRELISAYLS